MLETYQVELKNMREDSCNYEYSLNNDFFAAIDAPDIQKGNVQVSLSVKKGIAAFDLNFHVKGSVIVSCDRCLDEMEVAVEAKNSLRVKLGVEFSDDEDLITVPEEEGYINVAWFMYEFIALSLPMKHVHAPGGCNEEMMGALNHHLRITSGDEDELDEEWDDDIIIANEDEDTPQEIDPRWDALKKILNNN